MQTKWYLRITKVYKGSLANCIYTKGILDIHHYYPLFRVRSWNNGVRCMSFYILSYRQSGFHLREKCCLHTLFFIVWFWFTQISQTVVSSFECFMKAIFSGCWYSSWTKNPEPNQDYIHLTNATMHRHISHNAHRNTIIGIFWNDLSVRNTATLATDLRLTKLTP